MAAFEKIINVQHAWPGLSRANLPPNMRDRQVVVAWQPASCDLSFVSVGRIDGCSRDWQNRLGARALRAVDDKVLDNWAQRTCRMAHALARCIL
jgi:hypothetical protein